MIQYSSSDFISHRIFISASSPFYIPVLGRNLEVQSYWWVLQTLRTKQSAHFWLQRRHLFFRLRKRERSRGRDLGVPAKLVTRSLQCAECFLLSFLYQDLCKKWIVWQVRWNQLRVFSGVLTQRDLYLSVTSAELPDTQLLCIVGLIFKCSVDRLVTLRLMLVMTWN